MTFKQQLHGVIAEIDAMPKEELLDGHIVKKELLSELLTIPNPTTTLDKAFFNMFIKSHEHITKSDDVNELNKGQVKRICAIFSAKTTRTKVKRQISYIKWDMRRYLFKYEYDLKAVREYLDELNQKLVYLKTIAA